MLGVLPPLGRVLRTQWVVIIWNHQYSGTSNLSPDLNPPLLQEQNTILVGKSRLKRHCESTWCNMIFFFPFQPHCSEKATKVQDIKNNLKEAIEVRAWSFSVLSFSLPFRQRSPLTFAPSFSDHRGRHEQPGAPCGAGQPREPVQSGLHSERDERAGLWFPSRKPSLHPLPTPPGTPLPLLCHKTQFAHCQQNLVLWHC